MSLKTMQNDVDQWTGQYTPQYFKPHEMLGQLLEETGEVAREISHLYGPKKPKMGEVTQGLGSELADVLFTITCIANANGVDLEVEREKLMARRYGRDKDRFEKKEKSE